MQHNTQVEDPGGDHQAGAAANGVCQKRRGEGAKEGAGGENGHDGGLLRGGDVGIPVGVDVARAKETLPVGHSQDSTDGTSVVSTQGGRSARLGWMRRINDGGLRNAPKENTAECNKHANHESRPCFACHVVGPRQGDALEEAHGVGRGVGVGRTHVETENKAERETRRLESLQVFLDSLMICVGYRDSALALL